MAFVEPERKRLYQAGGLGGAGVRFRRRSVGRDQLAERLEPCLLAAHGAAMIRRDALHDREDPRLDRGVRDKLSEPLRDDPEHVLRRVFEPRGGHTQQAERTAGEIEVLRIDLVENGHDGTRREAFRGRSVAHSAHAGTPPPMTPGSAVAWMSRA